MKVPLSWLREFVDITLSPDDLAELLTRSGMEVAGIERYGVEGAELAWDPEKVLIGNILEVRQHPNADRLVLADVDYGAEQPHTVVTGAPNLFEYRGLGRLTHPLKGVFAREGAELYDGHAEGKVKVKLKGRPVRGVMSDAMLCSEKELGLSEEHEGIIILPEDAPVGAPLRDYLGDVVIEIDILPNIARAMSILGVAREVAALTGAALHVPEFALDASGPSVDGRLQVTVETPDLCPRFTATLIEGITIGTSPYWMQRRLLMAGMRPINNIVDVSNYVMLELGQPNHTFDADAVADQHLVVRLAKPGEMLITLDGKEHELKPDHLLVADPSGPLSLAGVMGGEASEVSQKTTRILVEAAVWDPRTIRRISTALRARSEASRRFERGVDYEIGPLAQRRALGLIQQVAGGTIAQGMIDVYQRPWQQVTLELPPREVKRIVGIELSASEIARFLQPLGFQCAVVESEQGPVVRVIVPSFRQDVTLLADLCEEVARMYGYDRIPTTLMADDLPEQRANLSLEQEQRIRDLLVAGGLDEVITYSMTNMAQVAQIDPEAANPANYLKLANPLSAEREYMRRSLLPTLIEALALNLNEQERVLMFEIGRVYLPRSNGDGPLPDEPRLLGIALSGARSGRSWHSSGNDQLDFFDLKGVVEMLGERLGITGLIRFVPLTNDPRFHPGRAARLEAASPSDKQSKKQGNETVTALGVLGELHPNVHERLEIKKRRVLVAEINLDALIGLAQPSRYTTISRFPATTQDLSLVVGMDVPADRVVAAIRKYAGSDLESMTLIDVYEGASLGSGKRSLTYSLAFRSQSKTLSDADVNKVRAKIIKGLEYDIGATLRS